MKKLIFFILISSFLSFSFQAFADDSTTTQATDTTLENLTIKNPFDGQNNLYEQIFDGLNSEYEHIGKLSAQKILDNKWVITGGLNSVGFSYRKPFLDFGLSLNRTVAPDLFSNRFIVTDTFTVHIDASKVLTRLKNENAIDITQKNLAAFAGIVYERKFTWYHFADTYEEGLSTHFEKLFFPFMGVRFNSLKELKSDEYITKEDSISINSGAFASVPVYTGISAMGGALAKLQKVSKMELTRKSSEFGGADSLLLSYEKSKMVMAGVSLSLQADFMKILKMTLMSYDFNYKLDSSYAIHTKLNMNEVLEMSKDNPVVDELSNIIKTKEPNLIVLAPYIISEEKKLSETVTHKYNFLLLGGSKEAKTQQIEVTSNGILKTFFKHNFEKVKYTEDAISRLISSFIFAIFNSEIKAKNEASETKKLSIEYNSERNLLDAHEDINIENGDYQKLSLTFEGSYITNKTTGIMGKKYKERAKFHLENYSGVNPIAISMIDSGDLVAPYDISGKYEINLDGIKYFNSQSVNEVFDNLNNLCGDKPKTIFSGLLSLFDSCRRNLQYHYIDYLKDLSHDKVTEDVISSCEKKSWKYIFSPGKRRAYVKNCISEITIKESGKWVEVPLFSLKSFGQDLVNNTHNKIYYYNLFGLPNVFFHGSFQAVTANGSDFVTYFHEGKFNGLGVVDSYMRNQNLRAPASIVENQ